MSNSPVTRSRATVTQLVAANPKKIEFIKFGEKMPTAAKAAEVLRCEESNIVKTCILKVDSKQFIAVILQGADRINQVALRAILKCKKFSFASDGDVLRTTGYVAGGTPPVGLGQEISRILIDQKVLTHELVYGGGGEQESLIRISPQTIVELSEAEIVKVSV